tara:strand:+ start:64916 stop:66481 length:1566 start_codon:yes stop_codon:yes gene_type:complete
MSRDKQALTPTPFAAASADSHTSPPPAERRTGNALWVGAVLLTALALGVIFWLPGQLASTTPQADVAVPQPGTAAPSSAAAPATGAGAGAANTPGPAARPGATSESPWSEAQAARLRQAAQAALDALLQRQFRLEEQGAADWASAQWKAALSLAQEGDALYQSRDFTAAEARYREAASVLEQLENSIPTRIENALAAVENALQALDAKALGVALDTLTQLQPDHPRLPQLEARAEQLEPLRELLREATAKEETGDLARARELLREATALDPTHRAARTALERVSAALAETQFQRAMSAGYAALDAGDYAAAKDHFGDAAAQRLDSPEVAAAREELAVLASTARLRRIEENAAASEQAGDWETAVERYREALEIDRSLVFAQEGLARALPRAELHRDLQTLLEAPERLAAPEVAREARALLAQARGVADAGPVLQAQREQLAQQLALATTALPVTLRSDGFTEVTVLRVSRLGSFKQKQLELRPGTYTAVGSRDGYRDVRETFSVAHDTPEPSVYIACSEPI